MSNTVAAHYLEDAIKVFKATKKLGDGAFEQIADADIHWVPEPESNSIAVVVKHMHGNMLSRWTDFLTSDGEKEWRERDNEFIDDRVTKADLIARWEEGWKCVFDAMTSLKPEDVEKIVYIRKESHTVMQAINRQLTHYAYHVGQIVYIAKAIRSAEWRSLSIPKGKSDEFNREKSGASR
ncbi:MAG TPA: DUF1572 family protein [Candidatus Kapabacteria bacterium]|nr:DUF1572 family protein [Candidatus Kapabacteria bacterium]